MTLSDAIATGKMAGLRGAFNIYCKYACNNRIKIWFVGDKNFRVGFPLCPYFCRDCKSFSPKAKDLYIKMGKWYPS